MIKLMQTAANDEPAILYKRIVDSLYRYAEQMRSVASLYVKAWVGAVAANLLLLLVETAHLRSLAGKFMKGQLEAVSLAGTGFNYLILEVAVVGGLSIAVAYIFLKYIAMGVGFSGVLVDVERIVRGESSDAGLMRSKIRFNHYTIQDSYEGYYTVLKLQVVLLVLVVALLVVMRNRYVEQSAALLEEAASGRLDRVVEIVEPAYPVIILAGLADLALLVARIYYVKPFFEALTDCVGADSSIVIYYILAEASPFIARFLGLLGVLLALFILATFFKKLYELSDEVIRSIGSFRASLKRALGIARL